MTLAIATPITPPSSLERALGHLGSLQHATGAWEGEVAWNPMLLAQYIIVRRIVAPPLAGAPLFDSATRDRMTRYFAATRTREGGWGMHSESGPYVFFTALSYVALRLLGHAADDPMLARAREWLRAQPEGVLAIPCWGRLWLAMLGLYEYEGINPIVPELFVLPEALPFHPSRYYCHTRYIYLAIASVFGRRTRVDLGALGEQLRSELYSVPYQHIDFARHRHALAASDTYVRPTAGLRFGYDVLSWYERVPLRPLRARALRWALARIEYETRASQHQALSPVNGLLDCVALFAADPKHPLLEPALRGVEAWRWSDDAEGIRYAGARSHAWDTAFALRALLDAPKASRDTPAIERGYAYLRDTQLIEELPGYRSERRDSVLGGWCFSDGAHRWPVSDCTAEAVSAMLIAHEQGAIAPARRVLPMRLRQAAEFILSRQNDDGGFGTYERRRGGALLEALNPSEMFGSCMTERSYVECTASCIAALARLRAAHPELCPHGIATAIARGERFLRTAQRDDGAWSGFWGVHFTYATFHAVEALHTLGAGASDPAMVRATRWLREHQRSDGGWGEHFRGAVEDRYVEHAESQVAMTGWAVLALSLASRGDGTFVQRGVEWLRRAQKTDGSWPRQSPAGVFFGTAMLDYRLYKDTFATWALARHASLGR